MVFTFPLLAHKGGFVTLPHRWRFRSAEIIACHDESSSLSGPCALGLDSSRWLQLIQNFSSAFAVLSPLFRSSARARAGVLPWRDRERQFNLIVSTSRRGFIEFYCNGRSRPRTAHDVDHCPFRECVQELVAHSLAWTNRAPGRRCRKTRHCGNDHFGFHQLGEGADVRRAQLPRNVCLR